MEAMEYVIPTTETQFQQNEQVVSPNPQFLTSSHQFMGASYGPLVDRMEDYGRFVRYGQVFALLLRPKKDHKYRFLWNIYHHALGYAIITLGIVNVFEGLNILHPEKKWKSLYIIILIVLGAISVLLEAITWVVVLRRKSNKSTKPYA